MNCREFQAVIDGLSDGCARHVSVFGCGYFGLKLVRDLSQRLVYVHSVIDNDPQKWGYLFEGIVCRSPEQMERFKQDTLVLVSVKDPAINGAIHEQLAAAGFPFVADRTQILPYVDQTPASQFFLSEGTVPDIDYNEQTVRLLQYFNRALFDVTKHYEDLLHNLREANP